MPFPVLPVILRTAQHLQDPLPVLVILVSTGHACRDMLSRVEVVGDFFDITGSPFAGDLPVLRWYEQRVISTVDLGHYILHLNLIKVRA